VASLEAPKHHTPAAQPSGPASGPTVAEVLAVLRDHYGPPEPRHSDGPLAELILTILSQNTSDLNTERAFASLWSTFGSWTMIVAAPASAIADAIRSGGLAEIKGPRIKSVLEAIHRDRGELSLDFLGQLPVNDARTYLTSLKGVGPKTAACVLLFALGMPAMPVDTHVHRVSKRLGLIGPKVGAEAAHQLLEASIPPEQMYDAHMLLIRHGRVLCKALRPRCDTCPLADSCPKIGVEA
jgi:endonuclease-3